MTAATDRAPTAALFNYSYSFKQPDKTASIPPTIRKIVIVGGGIGRVDDRNDPGECTDQPHHRDLGPRVATVDMIGVGKGPRQG